MAGTGRGQDLSSGELVVTSTDSHPQHGTDTFTRGPSPAAMRAWLGRSVTARRPPDFWRLYRPCKDDLLGRPQIARQGCARA